MKRTTAADLIEQGTDYLDAIAAELPTHDAPAQRQGLNDSLDAWLKDNARYLYDLSDDERQDVENTLSVHCGSLHTNGSDTPDGNPDPIAARQKRQQRDRKRQEQAQKDAAAVALIRSRYPNETA